MSNKKPVRGNSSTSIDVRAITSDDWANIQRLFGPNGACGGCWCMWWRVPRGGKLWDEMKGERNKRAFRRLVRNDQVFGCLAFADSEPIGWCCVGPRMDFPRLDRTKALRTEWTEHTWSVTCFFIKSGWRKRGVAGKLLIEAVKIARANGAAELEAYPVRPKSKSDIPGAFAWTGVPSLFERAGFAKRSPAGESRDVYALDLRRRKRRRATKA